MNSPLRRLALCIALTGLTGCLTTSGPHAPTSEPLALSDEGGPSIFTPLPPDLPPVEASGSPPPANATGIGRDVFARINRGLNPDSCAAGGTTWRKRYAGNPRTFSRHLEQILPLLDFVSIEVERAGLPAEFVFIPLVESWYKPEAIGPGGPAGMWQMISSTSRNHGIHITAGYDGRLSPVESTRAALSYLKTLQRMFGGWQAIVMAYNAGEGRLMRAFRRSANRNVSAVHRKPHGLSNITYDYVAKLQALSCLVSEPGKHGLSLPLETRFVPLAAVLADPSMQTLDQFAAANGGNPAELRRLNPGFKGGRIVAGIPRLVLSPFPQRQADAAASPEATEATATHEVRDGESLWSIAKRYRLTIEQLRRINRISEGSVVRPGQTLRLLP